MKQQLKRQFTVNSTLAAILFALSGCAVTVDTAGTSAANASAIENSHTHSNQASSPVSQIPQPAMAEHRVTVANQSIDYTVHWVPLPLQDNDGNVNAYMSGTAYIKQNADSENRPVIFFFNGGPGASSSPMHRTLGPQAAENPNSHIFEHADMVFVDPVGTGFSRNFSEQTPYWSREGDARAAVQYLQFWRKRFDREHSDFFMAGASYGSFRLAMMLPELTEMGISGGIFVSPSLDFSGNAGTTSNNRPYVHRLPTKAVAAWYHGVANQDLTDVVEVHQRAREFAESDYLLALYQGNRLPAEKSRQIAARMAELTGLSEDYILGHNLRIPTQDFLENLLEHELLGRLDVRVTQPKEQPAANEDRPPAANDPSLGMGSSNKLVSEALGDYFRNEVGVNTDNDYYSINLDLNFAWEWRNEVSSPEFVVNPLNRVVDAMETNPGFRILVLGGYFDMTTPVSGQEYTFTRYGIDPERSTFKFVPAPHAPFDSDKHREELVETLRTFISQH